MSLRIRPLVAAVTVLVLVTGVGLAGAADSEYTGSDPFSNVSPSTNVKGDDALVNRHPIGHYSIDNDAEVSITNLGDIVGATGHAIATLVWEITYMLINGVISLFTWAFSLDLLGAESGDGALAPVADFLHELYSSTFGEQWLITGIILAGMWGMWKALVQRRYSETAGALGLSVVFLVVALAFVTQPEQTVGRISSWTNDMSLAFISVGNSGDTANPEADKQEIADRLFESLIYDPWVVLEFGGMSHCVAGDDKPVACSEDHTKEINHKFNQGGAGGYAEAVLAHPPRSEERDKVLDGIGGGETPEQDQDNKGKAAAPIGKIGAADKPAIDIQLAALGFQRAGMAVLIFLGSLGAAALLGSLALAVILAQVLALLLLVFAPIALVVGVFPGRGHDFFKKWLGRIMVALVAKAIYSLVLAAVLTVASALLAATGKLDWLLGFALVAAFYWSVFLYRRQIAERLMHVTAQSDGRSAPAPTALEQRLPTMGAGTQAARQVARRVAGHHDDEGAAGGAKIDTGRGALRRTADRELGESRRGDRLGHEAEKERKRELRLLGASPVNGPEAEARRQKLEDAKPTGEAKQSLRDGKGRLLSAAARERAGLPPDSRAQRRAQRQDLGERVRGRQNGHRPSLRGPTSSAAAGGAAGAAAAGRRNDPQPRPGQGAEPPSRAPAAGAGRASGASTSAHRTGGAPAREPAELTPREQLAHQTARYEGKIPEPPKKRLNLDELDADAPPSRPTSSPPARPTGGRRRSRWSLPW